MKTPRYFLRTVSLLALSVLAPFAWAFPDDCQFNLSQPVLDYGRMNRATTLGTTAERSLGVRRLSLNLSCSKPIDMSVFYRAIAASSQRFRFAEHGHYEMRIGNAVLDGQPVDIGLISGPGQPVTESTSSLIWRPEYGIVPVRAGIPLQGRSFAAQLELTAWIQAQGWQLRDVVFWEASGVFDSVAAGRARETTLRASFAPAACEPVLSNAGVVDFGTLPSKNLNTDKSTRLPPKTLTLRVSCDAPAHFALRLQDNRQGSATVNSEVYYGLGFDHRNNKVGLYSLTVDPANATADSFPRVYRTDSTTFGAAWSTANAQPISISQKSYLGFTDSAGGNAGPVAIQHLATGVSVDVVIAPASHLDLSTAVNLDGSATLEIVYL